MSDNQSPPRPTSLILADALGHALRVSRVDESESETEKKNGDSARINANDGMTAFIGGLMPIVAGVLLSKGEEAGAESTGGSLASFAGTMVQLAFPAGPGRLASLDPATAVVEGIGVDGATLGLLGDVSALEFAQFARGGAGPVLVAVLALEAGIEQILERLRQIEAKIDEILEGMERERVARMRGTLAYLADIVGTIRRGGLDDNSVVTFSGEVESSDREMHAFSEEYRAITTKRLEELDALDIAGANLDIDDDARAIDDAVDALANAVRGLLLSLSVRMTLLRIRALLPIEQTSTEQRIKGVHTELERVREEAKQAAAIVARKAEEIHGLRQEVMQKTGKVLGGAGSLLDKSVGGRLAKGLGKLSFVGDAVDKVGTALEGTAGVEKARAEVTEHFRVFADEVESAIAQIEQDHDAIDRLAAHASGKGGEVVVEVRIGEEGDVEVLG